MIQSLSVRPSKLFSFLFKLISLLITNSPNFAVSENAGWKVKWRAGDGISGL